MLQLELQNLDIGAGRFTFHLNFLVLDTQDSMLLRTSLVGQTKTFDKAGRACEAEWPAVHRKLNNRRHPNKR